MNQPDTETLAKDEPAIIVLFRGAPCPENALAVFTADQVLKWPQELRDKIRPYQRFWNAACPHRQFP